MSHAHLKKRKHGSGRGFLRAALFCVFLAVFLFSGYKIISYFSENHAAADSYSELRMIVKQGERKDTIDNQQKKPENGSESKPDNDGEADDSDEPQQQVISMDFDALKEINPEIVAWIKAEGTKIDYPVLRADDNEYYLKHMYNGKRNGSGSIFVDYRNTGLFTEPNTVIYGHHMKNKTMFTLLEKYKSQDFYDANPSMTFYTPEGDYIVELISGTLEDGNNEFVRFDFESDEDFISYVESFCARSTFKSAVTVQPGDRIISLCTCSYERLNARYMVIGRLVGIAQQ